MEAWLETLAMLALLSGINSGAEWYTESVTDPIDDTRSVTALRLERPGRWTRTGRYRLLYLSCEELRPHEKPSLSAAIAWDVTVEGIKDPPEAERQRTTEILTRFGDGQAQRWQYELVETGNELFVTFPHDMDRFLKEAKKATEVALRLEDDVAGTYTTVFDLTGSARVINAMESGCESPSQSRTPQIQPPSRPAQDSPPRPAPSPRPSDTARGSSNIVSQSADAPLSTDDQAWVRSSCPRHLGPKLWSNCVRRAAEAIRGGMPDISGLATQDQAWVRSSCPRHLGPALWSNCVRRAAEAIRGGNTGHLRSSYPRPGVGPVELSSTSWASALVKLCTAGSRSDPQNTTTIGFKTVFSSRLACDEAAMAALVEGLVSGLEAWARGEVRNRVA